MSTETGPCGLTRRKLLRLAAFGGVASLGLGEGYKHEEHIFDRKRYEQLYQDERGTRYLYTQVRMPNLAPTADGLGVVFLTDLHADAVGVTRIDAHVLAEMADEINRQTARVGLREEHILLALGGDFVNQPSGGFPGTDYQSFLDCLTSVGRIRAGKRLASSGNHEACHPDRMKIRDEFRRRGYSHLGDTCFQDSYRGLSIVGLRDFITDTLIDKRKFYGSSGNIQTLSSLLSGEEPKLVLAHASSSFDPSVVGYRFQNVHGLSGHLHGLYAPKTGVLQRAYREATLMKMRSFGFEGDLTESQAEIGGLDGIPSSLDLIEGPGNHPKYNDLRRQSAYTVLIMQCVAA